MIRWLVPAIKISDRQDAHHRLHREVIVGSGEAGFSHNALTISVALQYMTQAASSGPSTSQQSRQSQSHLQGFGD